MTAVKKAPHRHKILYGIYGTEGDTFSCSNVKGLEGSPVYPIVYDKLVAIVSDTLSAKIRPDRKNISAHQSVLHELTERTTILPIRFGTVARNAASVEKLLQQNQKSILSQLKKVHGCNEMGLRVSWDVANIYDFFIAQNPNLRAARDELLMAQGPARDQKIEVGRLYETIMNEDRKESTARVKAILEDACEEIVESTLKREKDVMNLACLVRRDSMDAFVSAVFEASKLFDNNFLFDYSGPWAPHNFVHLDLKSPSAVSKDED